MKNVKIIIEYDGTNFSGWQSQPEKRTVQGEIEAALKKITNEDIRIIGAGRTDQGVHALGQVANFCTSSNFESEQLRRGINSLTGDDLYSKHIELVDEEFNSRYSARTKVYHYSIIFEPLPLKIRYNWFVKHKLNVAKMKKVIPYLLGEHDFSNFSAEDEKENKVCELYNMNLTGDNSHIIIKTEGDRFLRKMVRGMVGFICDVGRERFSSDQVSDVFEGRIKDVYFAPPQGLFLVEVKY